VTNPETSSAVLATPEPADLKRNALGTGGIVFLVVSAAAPLTVMAGVAPLAIAIAGIGAPSAYLIAGIMLAIFAVAFMGMSRHVKGSGGFYSYITVGLGRHIGLGAATVAFVSYNALQIGLYGLLGLQAQSVFATLTGVKVPWWLFAIIALMLVWWLGYRGIDVGAKVLGVLLVAESAILGVLAVWILAHGGAHGISFASFSPHAIFTPGMAAVLGISFAAFMGFEATALYRKEARNPDRTIPRATYIAVGFMGLFYAFITWSVIQAFGDAQAPASAGKDLVGFFFTAMDRYVGTWGALVMSVLLLTSVYAAQLAFHNSINRYTFSLARDGIFPRALGHVHPKFGSPSRAGTLQSVMALIVILIFAVAGADPYLQLLLWVNSPGVFGILILQGLTAVAVIVFFMKNRALGRAWHVVPAAIVAAALMVGVLALVLSNISLLTNSTGVVNYIIVGIVPVSFVIGMIWAQVLKRRRPEAYQRIGKAGEDTLLNSDALGLIEAPVQP
jgi:amino acid transporter